MARLALPADRRPAAPRTGALRPAGLRDPRRRGRRLRGPARRPARDRPRSRSTSPIRAWSSSSARPAPASRPSRRAISRPTRSCRRTASGAIVSGDEANQAATKAAFGLLHRGVVEATRRRAPDRGRRDERPAVGAPRAARPGATPPASRRSRSSSTCRPTTVLARNAARPATDRGHGRRPPPAGRLRTSLDGPSAPILGEGFAPDRRPARSGRGRPGHDPAAPEPAGRPGAS